MEHCVHSKLAQIIIEDLVKLDHIYYTLGTVKPAEREAIPASIFKAREYAVKKDVDTRCKLERMCIRVKNRLQTYEAILSDFLHRDMGDILDEIN